ncbi:MAG: hypothetical protein AAGA48_20590 [Myxococcota bacterium]
MDDADTAMAWVSSLTEQCEGAAPISHDVSAYVNMLEGLELPSIQDECALILEFDPFVIDGEDALGNSWSVEVTDSSATVTPSTNPAALNYTILLGAPPSGPSLTVH